MLNIDINDVTISMALGKCDEYSKNFIQYYLDNFDNKIVVIYKDGTPDDYIINKRVKYVKNLVEKIHPIHINQQIKETETEYVAIVNWKYVFTKEDLQYAVDKLNQGYGLVDMFPTLGISVFSKHLISIIGFWDEWMVHNADHEFDMVCRLRHFDIALLQHKRGKIISRRTMHQGKRANEAFDNYAKMTIKWKNTPDGFVRQIAEKNSKDKKIYKNKFQERNYLKFKDSIIQDKYVCERCNLWKSGISFDNFNEDIWDANEKEIMKSGVENVDY